MAQMQSRGELVGKALNMARTKVRRALSTVQKLETFWNEDLSRQVTVVPRVENDPLRIVYRVQADAAMTRFIRDLGDAIKAGREALDNFMSALAIDAGYNVDRLPKPLYFPIGHKAKDWKKFWENSPVELEPTVIRRLKSVQPFVQKVPYKGVKHPLSFLNYFANADKHRVGFDVRYVIDEAAGIRKIISEMNLTFSNKAEADKWERSMGQNVSFFEGPHQDGSRVLQIRLPQTGIEEIDLGSDLSLRLAPSTEVHEKESEVAAIPMTAEALSYVQRLIEYVYGLEAGPPEPWWPGKGGPVLNPSTLDILWRTTDI